ncbi:hypothetical protein L1987_19894 [Smallanthus sonchifolius]|uniref:Uncharacterized protein n=1 Tax=Smallanthus sonchifolius TaxID=185202 RepID=A0ACB9IRJ6_9ASTR|nr:hypothetical protein L1987_19894 [Smallanthus sonchifolius]
MGQQRQSAQMRQMTFNVQNLHRAPPSKLPLSLFSVNLLRKLIKPVVVLDEVRATTVAPAIGIPYMTLVKEQQQLTKRGDSHADEHVGHEDIDYGISSKHTIDSKLMPLHE